MIVSRTREPGPAGWDATCLHCGAKVQRAARRCWLCRRDIEAAGAPEHSDARSPATRALAKVAETGGFVIGLLVLVAFGLIACMIAFLAVCGEMFNMAPGH